MVIYKREATLVGSEEQEKETAQFSVLTLQWRCH